MPAWLFCLLWMAAILVLGAAAYFLFTLWVLS